jgi:hypothetical protein
LDAGVNASEKSNILDELSLRSMENASVHHIDPQILRKNQKISGFGGWPPNNLELNRLLFFTPRDVDFISEGFACGWGF